VFTPMGFSAAGNAEGREDENNVSRASLLDRLVHMNTYEIQWNARRET
jgi:hypothetical protein